MRARSEPRTTYQHGNLREALVSGALALVAERGIHAFSLAEAARRAGVSVAAPYRHFRDRSELLAAVATLAYGRLASDLEAAAIAHPRRPVEALAAMAAAYVTFAQRDRAAFSILFEAGLEKADHPELRVAGDRVMAAIGAVAAQAVRGDAERATALVLAVAASAHGFALFALGGALAEHGVDGASAAGLAAASARELASAARRKR